MKQSVKEFIRNFCRYTPQYKREYNRYQYRNADSLLEDSVRKAIRKIPFYKSYNNLIGNEFDLSKLPIIRKKDILNHWKELINPNAVRKLGSMVKTGGSTGVSLNLFYSFSTLLKKNASTDFIVDKFVKNPNMAILRGYKLSDNKITERINSKQILLSSYKLFPENLDEYLNVLWNPDINMVMAYPSSLVVLCRMLKNKNEELEFKNIKLILTSSEILDRESKKLIKDTFKFATLVDLYGHNEQAVCAYSVDFGPYKFIDAYGYVEFIGNDLSVDGNRVAEIIATSIMNEGMPLIRYGTEDFAELNEEGEVINIIGRTSDFLVTKDENIIPCTVLIRPISKAHVVNFQFYQATIGKLVFRVVVDKEFDINVDGLLLKEDLQKAFGDNLDCDVVVVESIERTKAGKQKRLVQDIDISNYR